MARKKKQPAQDVQENTLDTSGKLPDPKDVKIDTAFDIAGAGFLIHKAAEYYGKPLNETTLADAFEMIQEENSGLTIVHPVDRIKEVVELEWQRNEDKKAKAKTQQPEKPIEKHVTGEIIHDSENEEEN